jgi:hypothetical protein
MATPPSTPRHLSRSTGPLSFWRSTAPGRSPGRLQESTTIRVPTSSSFRPRWPPRSPASSMWATSGPGAFPEIELANYEERYAAIHQGRWSQVSPRAVQGRQIWINSCASCHQGPGGIFGGTKSDRPFEGTGRPRGLQSGLLPSLCARPSRGGFRSQNGGASTLFGRAAGRADRLHHRGTGHLTVRTAVADLGRQRTVYKVLWRLGFFEKAHGDPGVLHAVPFDPAERRQWCRSVGCDQGGERGE